MPLAGCITLAISKTKTIARLSGFPRSFLTIRRTARKRVRAPAMKADSGDRTIATVSRDYSWIGCEAAETDAPSSSGNVHGGINKALDWASLLNLNTSVGRTVEKRSEISEDEQKGRPARPQ